MTIKTKIHYLILSLFLGLGSTVTTAQNRPLLMHHRTSILFGGPDTVNRKEVLICYPTNFVASTLKVGYEFRVSHNKGLKFMASLGSSNSSSDFYGLDKFNEVGFETQLRFYILNAPIALNGLYIAPYASFKSMNYSGNVGYNTLQNQIYPYPAPAYVTNGSTSNLSLGYVIGYQWIYNSTFTVDIFAGGGDNFISGNNTGGNLSNTVYEYRSGIDFHSGIGIGIAF